MKIIKENQNTKECKKWEHEKNWEKKVLNNEWRREKDIEALFKITLTSNNPTWMQNPTRSRIGTIAKVMVYHVHSSYYCISILGFQK